MLSPVQHAIGKEGFGPPDRPRFLKIRGRKGKKTNNNDISPRQVADRHDESKFLHEEGERGMGSFVGPMIGISIISW